ncbi:MAG: hypothetical protein DDT26_02526 [Dehalococcoidia bacterium]|nr:hypothetical protein [Chloroflexota bacterium]
MEMVLDVYKRPFDPQYPVVCMDESPKQLIAETKTPIPAFPGEAAKHDYESDVPFRGARQIREYMTT